MSCRAHQAAQKMLPPTTAQGCAGNAWDKALPDHPVGNKDEFSTCADYMYRTKAHAADVGRQHCAMPAATASNWRLK